MDKMWPQSSRTAEEPNAIRADSDLSAGRPHAAVHLHVALQDVAQLGGGVSPDQPGSGQEAREEGLEVQQELVHRQATRPSHGPVQSCQGVGRGPGESSRRAGRLLLLQTLCGVSAVMGTTSSITPPPNNVTLCVSQTSAR